MTSPGRTHHLIVPLLASLLGAPLVVVLVVVACREFGGGR